LTLSTDPTNLLRMLEPAVRPDGRSAKVSGAAQQGAESAPFEARPFDQLLQEAKQGGPIEAAAADSSTATPPRALASLGDMTHIENASLRQQLEARANGSLPAAGSHASTSDSTH